MSEPRIDAERLAAFLDGRLDEAAREKLLAELAASEEARDMLGDVAAVLRDLELAGDVPAADLPAPRRDPSSAPRLTLVRGAAGKGRAASALPGGRRAGFDQVPTPPGELALAERPPRARRRWLGGALAGTLVLAAVGLSILFRTAASTDVPEVIAARLGPGAETAAATFAWPATRGAFGPTLAPRALAVRFGATAMALELAVRARDRSVATLAGRAAALLDDAPGAAPAAQLYRAAALRAVAPPSTVPGELTPLLREAWAAAAQAVDERDAALGAWLAAARAAAAHRDTVFFRAPDARAALDTLAGRADVDAAARESAARARDAAGAPDWGTLRGETDALLLALGG